MNEKALRYNSGKIKLSYLPLEIIKQSINQEVLLVGYHEIKSAFDYLELVEEYINSDKPCPDVLAIFSDQKLWHKICAVLEIGAKKYERNNWKKGLAFEEIIDSALRHFAQIITAGSAEDLDDESGLPHIDHIWCNLMFIGYQLFKINTNSN
jgi:hypothetical protein